MDEGTKYFVRRHSRQANGLSVSFPRAEGVTGLSFRTPRPGSYFACISASGMTMQAKAYTIIRTLDTDKWGANKLRRCGGMPDAISRISGHRFSMLPATLGRSVPQIDIRRPGGPFFLGAFCSRPVGSLRAADQQDRYPGSHSVQARSHPTSLPLTNRMRGPEGAVSTPSRRPQSGWNWQWAKTRSRDAFPPVGLRSTRYPSL